MSRRKNRRRVKVAQVPAQLPSLRDVPSRVRPRYDSIINTLTGLGTTADKGQAGVVDMGAQRLMFNELSQLYAFNFYCARIVDLMPEECFRKGYRIIDDTDETDPQQQYFAELDIIENARMAHTWARLYGGGIMLPVLTEDIPKEFRNRPSEWLREPLDFERVISVDAIQVLDPSEARPFTYDGNWRSKTFRQARTWSITPHTAGVDDENRGANVFATVHTSRLAYIPGVPLPTSLRYSNGGIDDSVIQRLWSAIRTRTSVDQAVAILAQELKVNVMTIQALAEKEMGDQAAAFLTRMQLIAQGQSMLNTVLLQEGETYDTRAAPLSGFKDLDSASRASFAMATGYPQQVLFGEAPDGLNSDGNSHRKLVANMTASEQDKKLKKPLTWIHKLIYASQDGPTAGVIPEKWSIEFNALDELTEPEQVALEKVQAETDVIRIDSGMMSPEHIARSRYGDGGYKLDLLPIPQEILDDAEAHAEALREIELDRAKNPPPPMIPGALGPDGKPVPAAVGPDGKPVPAAVGPDGKPVVAPNDPRGVDAQTPAKPDNAEVPAK